MKLLKVRPEIYAESTVKRAISAYKAIATITSTRFNGYILVTFRKCKYNEERTVQEFENYLIGIENAK